MRSNLPEGFRTGEWSDAHDSFGVKSQQVLCPPRSNSLRHAAQVAVDADAVPGIPSNKFRVGSPTPERRSTVLHMHTIGSVKRDPRSHRPCAGIRRPVDPGGYRLRRHSLGKIERQSDDGSFQRKHQPKPDRKQTHSREKNSLNKKVILTVPQEISLTVGGRVRS